MKKYKEFRIQYEPFDSELLSGFLWDFNISGLTEDENQLKVYAEDKTDLTKENINSYLNNLKVEGIIQDFFIQEKTIVDKNWNETWEKKRRIIRIGKRIVVKPSFKKYKKVKDEIVITIDPKMSFGTGEHASTKLILHLMEKYLKEGDKVLDIGTGTGILSIVAIKLRALKSIAIDNDEWSYKNCIENCKLNKVRDKVKIKLGEITDTKERNFNVIMSNIQKNIILEIAESIREKIKKGGVVLLSGLLIEDEMDLTQEFNELGFSLLSVKKSKEWLAVALQSQK